MHYQADPLTVALVFEAPEAAAVTARLEAYPMVAAGLLDLRVVELGPCVPLQALFRTDALG